jgi:DNA-binding NarL/FixJ family response regulator
MLDAGRTQGVTMPIRITLADGHAVVRAGISALLGAEGDLQVVGSIGDGRTLEEETTARPDVVVMELSLPCPADGLAAIEAMLRHIAPPRVLVLTACAAPSSLRLALSAGAVGYVLKRSVAATLLDGIRTVAGGGSYLDAALTSTVAQTLLRREDQDAQRLSEREESVLHRLALGQTLKEIARQLGLSVKTIETYRMRGAEKLGLGSRVALMRYAVAHGWVGGCV